MPARTPSPRTLPQAAPELVPFSRPRRSYKKALLIALVIVLLAGAAYYFFAVYRTDSKTASDVESDAEVAALVDEVGDIMVLPQGETPTIATVSDPELLKSQPFFANAKKGDKVLIYTAASKVVLYDPVAKKIVEVAPIASGSADASQE